MGAITKSVRSLEQPLNTMSVLDKIRMQQYPVQTMGPSAELVGGGEWSELKFD